MRPATTVSLLCFVALGPIAVEAYAQIDVENPPQPPVERLARFRPFFGLYVHADQEYAGLRPWSGTLDVGPAVKGWYVEWVINTHHAAVDRQLRMLMTWDDELGRYRIWRFETTPQAPPQRMEGEGRFAGDTLVMEWNDVPGPRGQPPATFRNRAFMAQPDELLIITDVLPQGASEWIRLGEWRNRRRM